MSSPLKFQVTIQSVDADRLFHKAIDHAKARGMTVGAYNEARRRSPHELLFDIETLMRGTLLDAGCHMSSLDNVVMFPVPEPNGATTSRVSRSSGQ